MAESKQLRPPFIWNTVTKILSEDARYKRWSPLQIREMRNGVYKWKDHEEHTT